MMTSAEFVFAAAAATSLDSNARARATNLAERNRVL